MDSAHIGVGVANLLFIATCGVVGVRLLLLARRTREQPELFLGAGLCCYVTGIPILAFSGLGRAAVDDVNFAIAVSGLSVFGAGVVAQAAFTWKTFRPAAGWAAGAVLAVALCEVFVTAGYFNALFSAPPGTASQGASGWWVVGLVVPMTCVSWWSCGEALHQYGMARKRQAIGLGDAVVTNRLLLWAFVGFFAGLSNCVVSTLQIRGMAVTADPVAAGTMAAFATVSALGLYLVFMPPPAYVRFIERRAAPAT